MCSHSLRKPSFPSILNSDAWVKTGSLSQAQDWREPCHERSRLCLRRQAPSDALDYPHLRSRSSDLLGRLLGLHESWKASRQHHWGPGEPGMMEDMGGVGRRRPGGWPGSKSGSAHGGCPRASASPDPMGPSCQDTEAWNRCGTE